MSQILSLNTERQALLVSRGHLREGGDFTVVFQCTLDNAKSRLGVGGVLHTVQESQKCCTVLICMENRSEYYAKPNSWKEKGA